MSKPNKYRKEVYKKYNGRCAYCGCVIDSNTFHVDHIEPLKRHIKGVKKGINTLSNYNPSCPSCNASKCDWSLDEWRVRIVDKYKSLYNQSSAFRFLIKFNIVEATYNDVIFYFEKTESNG